MRSIRHSADLRPTYESAKITMVKLNLGCGSDIKEGFVNIDLIKQQGVDVVHDLSKSLPYESGSVDFILASDVLEHFPKAKCHGILKDWVRVLRSGGQIHVRVPNIELICEKLYKNILPDDILIELIYGGQNNHGNFHYNAFTKATLTAAMRGAGCSEIARIWDSDHNSNLIGVK